jgi:hypothetical protein
MTRKTDLIAIAEKLEAANEPNKDIFYDVGELVFGTYDWTPTWDDFEAFLNAGAWTSAAEMLVPEGCCIVRSYQNPDGVSHIYLNSPSGENAAAHGESSHFALALAAASCRAWAEMGDE